MEEDKDKQPGIEIEESSGTGGAAGGLQVDSGKPEIEPPLTAEEATATMEEGTKPGTSKVTKSKIPLQPAVIRLTFRMPGEILAAATGFEGWKPSEEALADIVEVYEALGIETDPRIQAIILPLVMYGGKTIEYRNWRRRGRPNDSRKEDQGSTLEQLKRKDTRDE